MNLFILFSNKIKTMTHKWNTTYGCPLEHPIFEYTINGKDDVTKVYVSTVENLNEVGFTGITKEIKSVKVKNRYTNSNKGKSWR